MSTNSTIATIMSNGKIGQIYCHWDGYLTYVGRILVNYYQTIEKAEKLIQLGDISSLGKKLEPSELVQRFGFNGTCDKEYLSLPQEEQDRLYDESKDHVSAYHRDRGEKLSLNTYNSIPQYLNAMKTSQEEFNYFMGFNQNSEPQWYLVTDQGFLGLCDKPGEKLEENSDYQINIADFEDEKTFSRIDEQRRVGIPAFLKSIGKKYNLGYSHSSEVTVYESDGNYSLTYYDPVTNKPFSISFFDSSNVTTDFIQSVLKEIVKQLKSQLRDTYPVYTKNETDKISQLVTLKDKITAFYRKKFDPENVAFEYFLALCHDQAVKDNADKNGLVIQTYELKAEFKKTRVKPYVSKKVYKLFEDLCNYKLENITITTADVDNFTQSTTTKWGKYSDTSKFNDYYYRLKNGIEPADDSQFTDPLLNSQIYSIFNSLYKQVLVKSMEHKLDQASVLQIKGNNKY